MRRLHLDLPKPADPRTPTRSTCPMLHSTENTRSHGTVDSKDILLVQATSHPTTPSSGQEITTTQPPAKIMMTPQQQVLSVLLYSLCVAQSVAWHPVAPSAHVVLRSSVLFAGDNVNSEVWQADSTDPCWQNLLDSDCNMSNMYASSFVAGKWIKSMPCAAGIEVGRIALASETIVCHVLYLWIWCDDIQPTVKNLTPQHVSSGLRYAHRTHDARCVPRIRSGWSGRHGLSPLEASGAHQQKALTKLAAGPSGDSFVHSFIHPLFLPHRFRMSALHDFLASMVHFMDGLTSLLSF
jgi:hypothetical protein